ncbi:hypothetical protein MRB53_042275 [Persea americana]|nr:hypothetical protein MRB53_042275 [Persea americana]
MKVITRRAARRAEWGSGRSCGGGGGGGVGGRRINSNNINDKSSSGSDSRDYNNHNTARMIRESKRERRETDFSWRRHLALGCGDWRRCWRHCLKPCSRTCESPTTHPSGQRHRWTPDWRLRSRSWRWATRRIPSAIPSAILYTLRHRLRSRRRHRTGQTDRTHGESPTARRRRRQGVGERVRCWATSLLARTASLESLDRWAHTHLALQSVHTRRRGSSSEDRLHRPWSSASVGLSSVRQSQSVGQSLDQSVCQSVSRQAIVHRTHRQSSNSDNRAENHRRNQTTALAASIPSEAVASRPHPTRVAGWSLSPAAECTANPALTRPTPAPSCRAAGREAAGGHAMNEQTQIIFLVRRWLRDLCVPRPGASTHGIASSDPPRTLDWTDGPCQNRHRQPSHLLPDLQ